MKEATNGIDSIGRYYLQLLTHTRELDIDIIFDRVCRWIESSVEKIELKYRTDALATAAL